MIGKLRFLNDSETTIFTTTLRSLYHNKMISVQSFTGSIEEKYLIELAKLRIQVFKDFPYLYDGDMDYEMDYLKTYSDSPDSIVVMAFDGDKVIGASTGIPLEFETENVQKPWRDRQYDVCKIFYFGESVLLKAYRGKGIGVQFFEHREYWATSLGRFDLLTFCGVIRPEDHPLKPPDYVPLDHFWKKRGYIKTKDLVCTMQWKDFNEEDETEKPLHFWCKSMALQ